MSSLLNASETITKDEGARGVTYVDELWRASKRRRLRGGAKGGRQANKATLYEITPLNVFKMPFRGIRRPLKAPLKGLQPKLCVLGSTEKQGL